MGIKKWILPECPPEQVEQLSRQTGLPQPVCSILCARGYDTPDRLKGLTDAEGLLSPWKMVDMDCAVERIRTALEQEERIAIYGDYDCDGITATALLTSYLQSVGADVFYYIPGREKEGYGLNRGAVDFIKSQGATLIITVDNGISAHEEVEYAATLGIDVVVTDHHTPRDTLPPAVAVINPHRKDCPFPFKHLAGVGVAFKLACALEEDEDGELLEHYSDLVTLGTIADVVSLTGENRRIVRHGLERLSETDRPGLSALIQVGGLNGSIGSEAVAFSLVPRLNAAGRMDCVDDAVELLLTDDLSYAWQLAESINAQNEERKKIENAMAEEIDGILLEHPDLLAKKVLIVCGKGWHHGVVGIVASKVMEKYGKPTLLFSDDGEVCRGSGRSLEGFSLINAITACSEHLTRFGGHTLAAGLTVPSGLLDTFIEQFHRHVDEILSAMPVPTCIIDCVLEPQWLTVDAVKPVTILEPFGQGNRAPLFLLQNILLEGIYPTADKKHIRLRLNSGSGSVYAVYFRMNEDIFPYRTGDRVDIVAAVSAGEYNGKPQLSIRVQDIRIVGVQQEQVLEQLDQYQRHRNGEYICARTELLPEREDFAAIYRYLRAAGGFRFGAVELYYRLKSSGIGYAKLCVALDVLEEMELIQRDGQQGSERIQLLPAGQKVDMSESKILISLRV